MTKSFCDICGLEMPWNSSVEFSLRSNNYSLPQKYSKDICKDCEKKIEDFIKTINPLDNSDSGAV